MKFREYFDRVSIINLPERTDRRVEMTEELRAAGLDLEPGHIEFFPAVRPKDAAGFESIGFHGCFRSHLGILNQARDANARRLLVLEDDASFVPRFRQDEESLVAELQAMEWGICYFGHALEPPDAGKATHLKEFHDGVMLSHFYAVNGKYIARLAEFFASVLTRPPGHPDGGPMSPDGALHFFLTRNPDVPCHVTTPNFGTQRCSRSDVSPKWFDHVPGLKQTVSLLRKVKRQLRG